VKSGKVSVSVSSRTGSQTSRSRLGLGPQRLVYIPGSWFFVSWANEIPLLWHKNACSWQILEFCMRIIWAGKGVMTGNPQCQGLVSTKSPSMFYGLS